MNPPRHATVTSDAYLCRTLNTRGKQALSMLKRIAAAAAIVLFKSTAVLAQTIYPIDRADILAGARFDLKVEFPAASGDVHLTINGQDAQAVTGAIPQLVSNEDGGTHSALWLRDATLPRPGAYEVTASTQAGSETVKWNVYSTGPRRARNVLLFIGDGMSMAHRTAARILSKGITQGKYDGKLAIDDMPYMALVSTAGTDSVITDSANSMSAYTTGHKSCVGALGVYCARNNDSLAHPRVENITSLAKRLSSIAVGIVTTSELSDATPAAMVAHTRKRSDMQSIVRMLFEARPEVALGGGGAQFLPKELGGVRDDGVDFVEQFKSQGYAYAGTASGLKTLAADGSVRRMLGIFHPKDIDGALDRKYLHKGTALTLPDKPDLVDETKAALDVLSRSDNGFMLMVESARIDKYSHSLDWERAVYDTIMLDNAVKTAQDFARGRDDTLIIVVADHAHPISLVGVFDDAKGGAQPRSKLAVHGDAGYPNYPAPDAEGYPPTPDVSRRLALLFAAYPDHCFSGRPSLEGEFQPTPPAPSGTDNHSDTGSCPAGSIPLSGNLPETIVHGVHSGDDVVLTAMGPGADAFHGQVDNTFVFRAIADALGLAAPKECRDKDCAVSEAGHPASRN